MKRKILRGVSLALCVAIIGAGAIMLGGCNSKKAYVDPALVEISTVGGKYRVSAIEHGVKINVTDDAKDVSLDFKKFFQAYPEFIGDRFYFTRSDVTKGDNTLIKGAGWIEQDKKNGNKLFKKLGEEKNDQKDKLKTRGEIMALEDHEGKSRMYILKDGSHKIYIDKSPETNIKPGETNITFRLHGNHGFTAEFKVMVVK